MAASDATDNATTEALRAYALQYPGTSETGACVNRAFKAGKKSFLFMGVKADGSYHVRVKLGDSTPEAEKLARKEPARYEPGMHGWTKVSFAAGETPPSGLLERWVDESYRLLATKKLVREIPEGGFAPPKKRRARKR